MFNKRGLSFLFFKYPNLSDHGMSHQLPPCPSMIPKFLWDMGMLGVEVDEAPLVILKSLTFLKSSESSTFPVLLFLGHRPTSKLNFSVPASSIVTLCRPLLIIPPIKLKTFGGMYRVEPGGNVEEFEIVMLSKWPFRSCTFNELSSAMAPRSVS